MYILLGLVFIGWGIFILVKPDRFYGMAKTWKKVSEPSGLIKLETVIGGGLMIVAGIAFMVVHFLK